MPEADTTVLFDHLIGAREQRLRYGKSERLCGFEIDYQLILCRRLHRQIGRLLALEDAIDVTGGAAVLIDRVYPIHEEGAGEGERVVDRGQMVFGRESNDQVALLRHR